MTDSTTKMPFEDFEIAYAALAHAIDQAGAEKETLFLTKLSLLLAHNVKDIKLFEQAIADALHDLGSGPINYKHSFSNRMRIINESSP